MGLLDRLKGESKSGGTFELMAHAQKMHPKK